MHLIVLQLTSQFCFAQSEDSIKHTVLIDFETRPRAEYRDNFRLSASDQDAPEFHISQRNRLSLNYQYKKRLLLHASFQEIHLWAKSGVTSKVGGVSFFELYVEPKIAKHWSVRIGRQRILLDNGRMFSDSQWSQQSRSHEGIRVLYQSKMVSNDVFGMFTRPYPDRFEARYSPVASLDYKFLLVNHLKFKPNPHFTFTSISAVDVFEHDNSGTHSQRATIGGRIDLERNQFFATVSGYYQYGENGEFENIQAYYVQPEIKVTTPKSIFRLGMEILSGDSRNIPPNTTQSFDVLYGVAWRFMGNMNLFTRFPQDVNGKGLLNPYLFASHALNDKVTVRADFHLFYTQHPLVDQQNVELELYLGFENDVNVKYKPKAGVELTYGLSYFLGQPAFEALNKVDDIARPAVWSYLMIAWQFAILRYPK